MLRLFRPKNRRLRVGLCLSEQAVALLVVENDPSGENKYQHPIVKNSFYCEYSSENEWASCEAQLRQFIDENNLKNAECYCVLSKEDYQLLLVEPPDVPETELVEAMRWKVKDLVNIDIDNMVIDTFFQPEKKSMYTVVAEKRIVSKLVKLVSDIGLELKAIDVEELSYRNFFDHYLVHDRGVAVINIAENEGKLLIIKNSNLYLSRKFSINYGGGAFDPLPEDEIVLELQRSLDYYERQMGQAAPAEIVFVGAVDEEMIKPSLRNNFQQQIHCVDIDNMLGECELLMGTDDFLKISGAALRRGAA